MPMVIDSGWIRGVRKVPSPNCDARPPGASLDLIVVHGISLPPGEFGGPWIDHLFCNALDPAGHPYFAEVCTLTVSSHFLVRRDGELVQYVPCDKRAWHAGRSVWCGRSECNDFSIGIELEGADEVPYEDAQYDTLVRLIEALRRHYPRIGDNIAGHEHVAPGRKTDPGPAFDWARLRAALAMPPTNSG